MKRKVNKPKKLSIVRSNNNLYLATAFCLTLAFLFYFYNIKKQPRDNIVVAVSTSRTMKIDVPSRTIQRGEKISEVPLNTVEWPSSADMSKFATSRAQLSEKYANKEISAYSPIPLSSLVDSLKEANAVVENIPTGFRAISVKVDVESAVEGWAQPGNYVDVIVLKQSSDPELGIEAKVIAENVKILSSGSSVEHVAQGSNAVRPPPTVTLLVSAEDALKIRTASTLGKLTFSLRGVGDDSKTLARSMNQKTLLGGQSVAKSDVRENYKGQARGPDGKLYVLDSESRWVKDIKEITNEKGD